MARLFEHSNCPNPVQWGSSPIKTAYIRETDPETNKTKWLPVGWICTGCGVFRSKSGWYPSGKADPVCQPRKPARESAREPAREVEDLAHEDDDKARQACRRTGPRQFRINPGMVAELLQISLEEVQEKLRSGEIPGWKDASRHWRVDLKWYLKQLRALGRSPAREGIRSKA